jgi:hypothetical protein
VVAYIKALQLSQNASAADAGGQPLQVLSKIAEQEGFDNPDAFVHDWALPDTAHVYGTPNGQDNGIPGQDKVTGPQQAAPAAAGKATTPNTMPGAPAKTTAAQPGAAAKQ